MCGERGDLRWTKVERKREAMGEVENGKREMVLDG